MKPVEKKILLAIGNIERNDLQEAFLHVAIAIDITAKKKTRIKGVAKRIKAFISEYDNFIYYFITGGLIKSSVSPAFTYRDGKSFADIYYQEIRNTVIHDGEFGNFNTDSSMLLGTDEQGYLIMSPNIIWAMVLIVITDPVNVGNILEGQHQLKFNDIEINLNEHWGEYEKLGQLIGFID